MPGRKLYDEITEEKDGITSQSIRAPKAATTKTGQGTKRFAAGDYHEALRVRRLSLQFSLTLYFVCVPI